MSRNIEGVDFLNNEKMMILKMLEDRKITSQEAAQLLQSLETGTPVSAGSPPAVPVMPSSSAGPIPFAPSPSPAPPPPPYEGYTNNGPAPRPGASYTPPSAPPRTPTPPPGPSRVEEIANDLGRRFEGFARSMEPKIQRFTETVASHIVTGADKLSKTMNTESAPRPFVQPPTRPSPAPVRPAPAKPAKPAVHIPAALTEKNIELAVTDGYNELNLSGMNGDIRIKGYNGDKITARVSYKSARAGAAIDLRKLGGKYYLSYDPDEFEHVSMDAYVPERLFQTVKIDNINGQIDISSLASNQMEITNGNGHIRLSAIAAQYLKADNSQGRFILSNIVADSAVIENVNGVIEADETDIGSFKLTNYNGPLTLLMSGFNRYNDYTWSIETGNAKLNMTLPTLPTLGYHIKAHTTLGEIRLGLTGLQFLVNDAAMTEARSIHYDGALKKVQLMAETSNGPLFIN
jgi:hypothetical protein